MNNLEIEILPNYFLKEDNNFDKEKALDFCGKIAGVCYEPKGFDYLEKEDSTKTKKRIKRTLDSGHHSVYDHVYINLNIKNIPKILAMVINNEKFYSTSEKSARYTRIVNETDSVVSKKEKELYNKWNELFFGKIKGMYGYIYSDKQIEKLSQENSRYLISVFVPTEMIYSTSFRQLNYLVAFMAEFIVNHNLSSEFENKLSDYMQMFINELSQKNLLEDGLMKNEKNRKISLLNQNIENKKDIFSSVYSINYEGSFSQLAQAQRHRTINYQIKVMDKKRYYVPEILKTDALLHDEWINDITSLKDIFPQGEIVKINERGMYEDFILKCKERLCSHAQLEIMLQTKETLLKYKEGLEDNNDILALDIENYTKGARCTFKDYECLSKCDFIEGKKLTRKI